jgi:hypothetical protein
MSIAERYRNCLLSGAGQYLFRPDRRLIDAAFQDEVAASEGFLKQPIGKDYQFGGPSIKDEKLFGVGTGMGLRKEDKRTA